MKKKITLTIIIVLILSIVGGTVYYISDYYRAEDSAVVLFASSKTDISEENGVYTFNSENAKTGVIFYPGGKVEAKAYAPLMYALAEEGIFTVLVTMPANLAVLDMDAAAGIQEKYPEIKNWYISGHSLGGSMAASFASENSDKFEGVILLASYSTEDLTAYNMNVLSIYGSNDGILNMKKYEECKTNLPNDFSESVIDGGCHAYFGAYGEQDGDGKAEITREEQIKITVEKIVEFIK